MAPMDAVARGDSTRVRRRRNSLTLEEVVTAGIELAERRGSAGLSLRAVAACIGASPMSIYNHVTSRTELELAMLERVTEEVDHTATAADAGARLHARFRALHDRFARARWALLLLVRGDLVPLSSFAFADACIGDLLELGLTPADAIFTYGTFWHLTLGEILDRHPESAPSGAPTQRDSALRTLRVDRYPNYAHVMGSLDPVDAAGPCHFERSFVTLLRGVTAPS
jgi:AcrR family transcriptional regulator